MSNRFQKSIEQLSALVIKKNAETFTPSTGEPLIQACQLIWQAMGLDFQREISPPYGLNEICAASKIRFRPICLEGDWWRETQDTLLGFDAKTFKPVALIHRGEEHYERVDPDTMEKTQVATLEQAEQLLRKAYVFYPPLPETVTPRSAIRFALRGSSRSYLVVVIVGLLGALVGFFFPMATQVLFDQVIPNFQITLFMQVLLGLSLSAISAAVFMTTRSLMMVALSGTIENRLQAAVWDRLLNLPLTFFRSMPKGDLIQRTLLVDTLRRTVGENILRMILNALFSSAYLLVMFYYSPQLTFVGLMAVLLGVGIPVSIFLMRIPYERKLWASDASLNAFLTQLVSGLGKCRVAAAESRAFTRWAENFGHNQWLQLKTSRLAAIASTATSLMSVLAPLLLFSTILWTMNVRTGDTAGLSIGRFLAFYAAFTPFSSAVFEMANFLASLVGLIPSWERLRPLINTPLESAAEKRDPGTLTGDIEVEHLFFRYHHYGDFILNDFSMKVEPGECLGVVGPSGCGKSSLCRLLLGFETAEKGAILFNQQPISWIDLQRLREQIGAVLQTSTLFFGTIYDNIAVGRAYSAEDMQRAMQLSTFERDLADLPMGLQTLLPSGGGILSGGQRQRLLLARALIRRPKILILDEATSALDNDTQSAVARHLRELQVTQIIVAHRSNALRYVDRIQTLDKLN